MHPLQQSVAPNCFQSLIPQFNLVIIILIRDYEISITMLDKKKKNNPNTLFSCSVSLFSQL